MLPLTAGLLAVRGTAQLHRQREDGVNMAQNLSGIGQGAGSKVEEGCTRPAGRSLGTPALGKPNTEKNLVRALTTTGVVILRTRNTSGNQGDEKLIPGLGPWQRTDTIDKHTF